MDFRGREVIVIGERDGVSAESIEACLQSVDAVPIHAVTECFVWTSAGAMDLDEQQAILDSLDEHDGKPIVILGSPSAESAELYGKTVTTGDPTYAGPLAGVSLGLPVFHILEDEVRESLDPEVYEKEVGMMEDVLEREAIVETMEKLRKEASS